MIYFNFHYFLSFLVWKKKMHWIFFMVKWIHSCCIEIFNSWKMFSIVWPMFAKFFFSLKWKSLTCVKNVPVQKWVKLIWNTIEWCRNFNINTINIPVFFSIFFIVLLSLSQIHCFFFFLTFNSMEFNWIVYLVLYAWGKGNNGKNSTNFR